VCVRRRARISRAPRKVGTSLRQWGATRLHGAVHTFAPSRFFSPSGRFCGGTAAGVVQPWRVVKCVYVRVTEYPLGYISKCRQYTNTHTYTPYMGSERECRMCAFPSRCLVAARDKAHSARRYQAQTHRGEAMIAVPVTGGGGLTSHSPCMDMRRLLLQLLPGGVLVCWCLCARKKGWLAGVYILGGHTV
jgi:hypothetical protein